ncbi:RuBisCO large subunit-binding protein subunit beta-2 [Auxenochlorella protothecoides]|uniref:RuBisCO large subunit-binding protein subunit beta-2 n=1 Tax=Auxenochlorella protothecoides TaxID=3075 RepID=A0A087SG55_AUXPR|nr:RuBisCO large subunit-binding protein subunit beta-2 [Auxenochlorella protothecoides]KFM24709.1 RuBisCO large subunit-binding protein subunit beta-2 [Auxenochlorella protothecoides]
MWGAWRCALRCPGNGLGRQGEGRRHVSELIASNAGDNGSVVMQRVLDGGSPAFGYNAATGAYEDLLAAGIIDPAKVIRCALENAASVAKTFLTSSVIVTEIPQEEGAAAAPADGGYGGY